jgi:hypothetical protein
VVSTSASKLKLVGMLQPGVANRNKIETKKNIARFMLSSSGKPNFLRFQVPHVAGDEVQRERGN